MIILKSQNFNKQEFDKNREELLKTQRIDLMLVQYIRDKGDRIWSWMSAHNYLDLNSFAGIDLFFQKLEEIVQKEFIDFDFDGYFKNNAFMLKFYENDPDNLKVIDHEIKVPLFNDKLQYVLLYPPKPPLNYLLSYLELTLSSPSNVVASQNLETYVPRSIDHILGGHGLWLQKRFDYMPISNKPEIISDYKSRELEAEGKIDALEQLFIDDTLEQSFFEDAAALRLWLLDFDMSQHTKFKLPFNEVLGICNMSLVESSLFDMEHGSLNDNLNYWWEELLMEEEFFDNGFISVSFEKDFLFIDHFLRRLYMKSDLN